METTFYENTYVCFLDILGFKDLVENNKPKKLKQIYEILFQKTVDTTTEIWTKGNLETLTGHVEIDSLVMSDSIVIWTSDSSPMTFVKMLVTVRAILFRTMNAGIPLRGAISSGQLTLLKSKNNTTVFGKGLVNAYKLESQQDWSGCIVEDELINSFRFLMKGRKSKNRPLKIEDIDFLLQYPVPMKYGDITAKWVLNWTSVTNPNVGGEGYEGICIMPDGITNAFSAHKKSVNNWRAVSIIRNTLEFWSYVMESSGAELETLNDREATENYLKTKFLSSDKAPNN